jgi:hypothetical protein
MAGKKSKRQLKKGKKLQSTKTLTFQKISATNAWTKGSQA